jgi:serine phosphatase RsbU (regulator of sigma subunit)
MDKMKMQTELKKIVSGNNFCLTWSAVRYPKENEQVCGDLFFIKNYRDQVLVAAIDGLGHGEEALQASQKAWQSMQSFTNQSLISIVNTCHAELKRTRGVVMSLAVLDNWERTMAWTGVGNVEGVLYRANKEEYTGRENIILRGGVVGYKLPPLKASLVSISPGDTLIFTTDGVDNGYREKEDMDKSPEGIVDFIASNYINQSDDALVIVARYSGVEF